MKLCIDGRLGLNLVIVVCYCYKGLVGMFQTYCNSVIILYCLMFMNVSGIYIGGVFILDIILYLCIYLFRWLTKAN